MSSELERTMRDKRRSMIQTTNLLLFLMMCGFVVFRFAQLGLSHPPYPAIICAILTLANSIYLYRKGSLRIACNVDLNAAYVYLVENDIEGPLPAAVFGPGATLNNEIEGHSGVLGVTVRY